MFPQLAFRRDECPRVVAQHGLRGLYGLGGCLQPLPRGFVWVVCLLQLVSEALDEEDGSVGLHGYWYGGDGEGYLGASVSEASAA